jgi:nucleotide-binding universal stress UspA family protein
MLEAEREFRRHGRALLRDTVAKLRQPAATELIEPGSPARGLAQLARQHRAATLVLGSSHRGPVGRLVPGGVASRLITCTPCATAIAPVGYAAVADATIHAVGVAYDGLAESDAALAAAAAAAVRLGVPLRLYHAMHEVPRDPRWEEFRGHMREFADGILKAGLARLHSPVPATTAVLEGDVATVVARTADDDDVGLLFVGSRGYGPVREALVRGVVGGLLRSCSVPLVIVPPAAGGASVGGPEDRAQPSSAARPR